MIIPRSGLNFTNIPEPMALILYIRGRPILLIKVYYKRFILIYKRCYRGGFEMNNIQTARISAMAFAAVLTVSALTMLACQDAESQTRIRGADQSNDAARQEGLVNAQVGLNANVQTGDICVQALSTDPRC